MFWKIVTTVGAATFLLGGLDALSSDCDAVEFGGSRRSITYSCSAPGADGGMSPGAAGALMLLGALALLVVAWGPSVYRATAETRDPKQSLLHQFDAGTDKSSRPTGLPKTPALSSQRHNAPSDEPRSPLGTTNVQRNGYWADVSYDKNADQLFVKGVTTDNVERVFNVSQSIPTLRGAHIVARHLRLKVSDADIGEAQRFLSYIEEANQQGSSAGKIANDQPPKPNVNTDRMLTWQIPDFAVQVPDGTPSGYPAMASYDELTDQLVLTGTNNGHTERIFNVSHSPPRLEGAQLTARRMELTIPTAARNSAQEFIDQLAARKHNSALAPDSTTEAAPAGAHKFTTVKVWVEAEGLNSAVETKTNIEQDSRKASPTSGEPDEQTELERFQSTPQPPNEVTSPETPARADKSDSNPSSAAGIDRTEIGDALRQLKTLHAEGLLTADEFETKRQRLADQL
jgi:hypothetical protein